MTMPKKLQEQIQVWHLVVAVAASLGGPGLGVYVGYQLLVAKVADQGTRITAVETDLRDIRETSLRYQGEIAEKLGRIDERLKVALERPR